jgi:hypothetical protein
MATKRLFSDEADDEFRRSKNEHRTFDFSPLPPMVHNPNLVPQCSVCKDMGLLQTIIYAPEPGARGPKYKDRKPYWVKLIPCTHPACAVGNETRARQLKNLLRNAGVKDGYRNYSFATWDQLTADQRQGKNLARLAMQMYVRRNGAPFAIDELYMLAGQGGLLRKSLTKEIDELGIDPTVAKPGIILAGTNGTGKTGLMASAAMQMLHDNKTVLFINALELMSDVFDGFSDGKATERKQVFKDTEHVMLDELTFESKDSHRRLIQELTRARHDAGLPILVTTNCTAPEFETLFGTTSASGLFGVCHWIEMWGIPLRHESPYPGGRR